jgi:anaerobic magnesium-protoporphyrin IX monomethyl ester cyclase
LKPSRALVVDLNNFARYPTVAVGYLASILRRSGVEVTVLSPLAHGVPGVSREPRETVLLHAARRLNYALKYASAGRLRAARGVVDGVRSVLARRSARRITQLFENVELEEFDVVLVSTYLLYYDVCADLGRRCQVAGVPLVIGGSYFANAEVARAWLDLPGLTALVGGEIEGELPALVRAVVGRSDLSGFAGVWLPDGRGAPRPPLAELDAIPFPDYADFPWAAYPHRIVPLITGRGCGWGVCSFCSDVTSTAGRTFRSRSPENVLGEIAHQSRKHETSLFTFTDLKLNSRLEMWQALIEEFPRLAPDPRWIASVHVASRQPNGLDGPTLLRARRAGLARLTTGLESGSQRVLDRLKKGTDLGTTSRFLHDAAAAGISVRVTMIHGSPGEDVQDIEASAEFLERHQPVIDRVSLNRFQLRMGPTVLQRYDADPASFPSIRAPRRNARLALVEHEQAAATGREYRHAVARLLRSVHRINRKRLAPRARPFEGVM